MTKQSQTKNQNPQMQNIGDQTEKGMVKESEQSGVFACRICLVDGREHNSKKQQYISPCNCSGSLKHVHESCLSIWVKKMAKKKKSQNGEIKCELCNYPFKCQIQQTLKFNSKEEIKQRIEKKKLYFIFCVFALVFFLGCIGALVYLFNQEEINFEDGFNYVEEYLIIVFILLGISSSSLSMFILIRFFLTRFAENIIVKEK